jgi:hypothetical protein
MKTSPQIPMRAALRLLTILLPTLAPVAAMAQVTQRNETKTARVEAGDPATGEDGSASQREKPFNLEFPGGPVQEFVVAVENATGAPFNVIIPSSAQELQIPPVRVKGVTLRPLLAALSQSSTQQKPVGAMRGGLPGAVQFAETGFSFTPSENGPQAVWQLTVRGAPDAPAPPPPPPTVRFYQLKPILEAGLKVEDVTTAAETAWKMMKLGKEQMPELKFHEETGLLIAAGSDPALAVIDSVIAAQPGRSPAPPSALNPIARPLQPLPPLPGGTPAAPPRTVR